MDDLRYGKKWLDGAVRQLAGDHGMKVERIHFKEPIWTGQGDLVHFKVFPVEGEPFEMVIPGRVMQNIRDDDESRKEAIGRIGDFFTRNRIV